MMLWWWCCEHPSSDQSYCATVLLQATNNKKQSLVELKSRSSLHPKFSAKRYSTPVTTWDGKIVSPTKRRSQCASWHETIWHLLIKQKDWKPAYFQRSSWRAAILPHICKATKSVLRICWYPVSKSVMQAANPIWTRERFRGTQLRTQVFENERETMTSLTAQPKLGHSSLKKVRQISF